MQTDIIAILQNFYTKYNKIPTMRVLIKLYNAAQPRQEQLTSIKLYQLFGESPIVKACKIAGLPKPDSCI